MNHANWYEYDMPHMHLRAVRKRSKTLKHLSLHISSSTSHQKLNHFAMCINSLNLEFLKIIIFDPYDDPKHRFADVVAELIEQLTVHIPYVILLFSEENDYDEMWR